MSLAYLNGTYLPLAEAHVSAMDRGFLFGDGVYEVVPVYGRTPFRLHEHLRRLNQSLTSIRLGNPHAVAEWESIVAQLIATSEHSDQQIYIQVTRGIAATRNHVLPENPVPTVFAMSDALLPPAPELLREGVSAVSADDLRWLRCDIKTTSLLANCLLRQLSADAGCFETVLFRDGMLSEGSASNIFIVKAGTLLAPPKNQFMLPGITYDIMFEIADANDLPYEVRPIAEFEVRMADEVLLTSSTREVMPIVMLDGAPVGNGRPGPLTEKLATLYQSFKQTVMYGKP
ncbi:MAG TPA: D-amino acid aminotransferase [Rhodocyclaceae bacterium]|nr:D-amino acid aminotransferase [Rhodocyclaceae bacterium]